ncbi:MAG: hypothetical protein V8S14_07675 [Lachnospiraceae bacterium]
MDKDTCKTIIGKDDCVSRVKITVNNKLAYSKSYANQGINSVNAKYARMTNKNEFVQLMAIGDNDCINVNKIYRYDNKSKKFVCVSKLDDTEACEIVSAKKNSLTLKHADQPAETGWLNWTMDYRVSNNKLVLADTTTSTVKSIIGNDRNDYYSKLFKKNTFVTAKKVNHNGSKVACKIRRKRK